MDLAIITVLQDLRKRVNDRNCCDMSQINEIEMQIDRLKLEIELLRKNISERHNTVREIDELLENNS